MLWTIRFHQFLHKGIVKADQLCATILYYIETISNSDLINFDIVHFPNLQICFRPLFLPMVVVYNENFLLWFGKSLKEFKTYHI